MKSTHRAWLTLAIFSVVLVLTGYQIASREGVLWALVISLGINAFIYLFMETQVLSNFSGEIIEGQDPWGLTSSLKELSQKARIIKPQIIVLKNNSPQTFLLSKNWKNSHIIITTGMLERFNEADLKAILAYCVATIKRQDSFAQLVASAFISFLIWISQVFDYIYRWLLGVKNIEPFVHNYPFTYFVSPLAFIFLKLLIKKSDYLKTDSLASSYLEAPQNLAIALWKLQSYSQTLPMKIPPYLAHGFIVNPLTSRGWTRYFHVQPAVKERIQNLIGYYPI